jgi:hypothetical protein
MAVQVLASKHCAKIGRAREGLGLTCQGAGFDEVADQPVDSHVCFFDLGTCTKKLLQIR